MAASCMMGDGEGGKGGCGFRFGGAAAVMKRMRTVDGVSMVIVVVARRDGRDDVGVRCEVCGSGMRRWVGCEGGFLR